MTTWQLRIGTCWLVIFYWFTLLTVSVDCATTQQSNNLRRAIDNSIVSTNNNVSQQRQTDASSILPVGEAFNLFQSYGLLAFNINVVPLVLLPTSNSRSYDGTSPTYRHPLFQMTTHPILDRKLYTAEIKRHQVNNPRSILKFYSFELKIWDFRVGKKKTLFQLCNSIGIVSRVQQQVMERSVRLHLCPSMEALMTRLLFGFTVDGLQKPWWAFTASWKKHVFPRIYGVPGNYLTDDYAFLLVWKVCLISFFLFLKRPINIEIFQVRIEKRSIVGSINGSMLLEPDLLAKLPVQTSDAGQAAGVGSKSWRSAVDFFLQFGTHIISDYSAGDALFQVIVYNSSSVPLLAGKLVELRSQVDQLNPLNATKIDWSKLLVSDTPPVHIGRLQVISQKSILLNLFLNILKGMIYLTDNEW